MKITFRRNVPGLSSKYVAFIHDCNREQLAILNDIKSDDISVIRTDTMAMVTFAREEDFNWYMLKWT